MKLRSASKQTKDKPVESQTRESNNDKRKTKAAGTSVGKGTTNVPLLTQSGSNSTSRRTKKPPSKSTDIAILGSKSASAILPSSSKMPAPTNPYKTLKTCGALIMNIPPSDGGGVIPNTLPTALTRLKKKIVVSTSGAILSACLGTPSNPPCSSNQTIASAPASSGAAQPALPPDWETRYIETYNTSSTYQTFPVDKSSSEFKVLADLLSPLRVTSAEQIINPELWQSFEEKRKAMLKSKTDDANLLKELGCSSSGVSRNVKLSEGFPKHHRLTKKYGEYSANEALLLHCTRDHANLEKIMADGLDDRLGRSGCLGKGIYFSDDPERCVQFDGSWGTILVFGVLLGDCLSVDDIPNVGSLEREPRKEDMQKRNLNDRFFDSIAGRPQGRFHHEYVIFNRNQCYPFYIVKYQNAYRQYPEVARDIYAFARKSTPIIVWRKLDQDTISLPRAYQLGNTWSFDAALIFKLMKSREIPAHMDKSPPAPSTSRQVKSTDTNTIATRTQDKDLTSPVTSDSDHGQLTIPTKRRKVEDEENSVCTSKVSPFCSSRGPWKVLTCNHRMCSVCYHIIEVCRVTISGMACTSVRCPFCQRITGIAVGDCPDGLMTVKISTSVCDGYGSYNSIKINYNVNSGHHQLNRTAYLPNSPEGKEILELLITAWDQKLTFKIGTSIATGEQNVLVWNIQHKTSQTGGVWKYGFPDKGYFTRVRAELKAFGIA